MGILDPCASWMRPIIFARKVSSPTRVTRIFRGPVRLREPPVTGSPSPLGTGIDSPVIIDSSTADRPSRISPSTGMRSPGRHKTTESAFTASMGTATSAPDSSSTRASRACSFSSPLISLAALSLREDSMARPVTWRAMIMDPRAPNDTM